MENTEILNQLTLIRGWFYSNLINPEKPMNKETAGRVLNDIQELISKLENRKGR